MRFRITRFRGQIAIRELGSLAPEVAEGIVELVWGVVPDRLMAGDMRVNEELKLHLGGPDWIIVQRTA
jgi:hypothetical protein